MFVLVVLSGAGGFAVTFWLVRRRPKPLLFLLPMGLIAIAFRLLLIYVKPLDVRLFPYDAYPLIEWWWVTPFVAFIFGAAAGRVRTFILRDVLLVAEGLAFLYFGIMAWGESFSDHSMLTGEADAHGLCRQTSGYSCGAAAAVSWLYSKGIAATEHEMAEVCATTRFFGTSLCGMVRGLARKLPGGRSSVSVENLSVPELASLGRPSLVIVKSKIVNHWIVVDAVGNGKVLVRDPVGAREIPLDRFERMYVGPAVW